MKSNNLLLALLFVCYASLAQSPKEAAAKVIDQWHQAASKADFDTYFNLMTTPGVFVGTDTHEHWDLSSFKDFSKPYFDRGKAWSFKSVERHLYENESREVVYFDELLETQMGICRGSGVVLLKDGAWKIAHYVLSITVPNDEVSTLLQLKKKKDSLYLKALKN